MIFGSSEKTPVLEDMINSSCCFLSWLASSVLCGLLIGGSDRSILKAKSNPPKNVWCFAVFSHFKKCIKSVEQVRKMSRAAARRSFQEHPPTAPDTNKCGN